MFKKDQAIVFLIFGLCLITANATGVENSCLNGGTLTIFGCVCPTGFTGRTCETDMNQCTCMCSINPCQNDGIYIPQLKTCACLSPYEGKYCEKKRSECTDEFGAHKCLRGDDTVGQVTT